MIQPAGTAGCIGQGIADCTAAPLLTAPAALAMGADGSSLTVATAGDGTILTLHRDIADRRCWRRTRAPSGCISTTAAGGCQALASARSGDLARDRARRATCSTPPRAGGLIGLSGRHRRLPQARAARGRERADADPHALPDPNGDALTYAIASKATHGTLAAIKGGSVTYRPKPGFSGLDAFGIAVARRLGRPTTATVTVRVTRAGTGPVVRLAAGPLKVRAGTARATIGCDARTAGGCTGVAILRLGGPRGPVIARSPVQRGRRPGARRHVPLRAAGAPRSPRAPGARRC